MSSDFSPIVHAIKTCLTEGANELSKERRQTKFSHREEEAEEFIHPLREEVDRFVQKESAGNKRLLRGYL